MKFIPIAAFAAILITPTGASAENYSAKVAGSNVTFTYKAAGVKSVEVHGSFNAWAALPLDEDLDSGVFTLTMHLAPGNYEYKFTVAGKWLPDGDNLKFNIGGAPASAPVVAASAGGKATFTFVFGDADATKVFIAGDWNGDQG